MGIALVTQVIPFKSHQKKIMMEDVGLKKKINPGFSQAAQKTGASWCVTSTALSLL